MVRRRETKGLQNRPTCQRWDERGFEVLRLIRGAAKLLLRDSHASGCESLIAGLGRPEVCHTLSINRSAALRDGSVEALREVVEHDQVSAPLDEQDKPIPRLLEIVGVEELDRRIRAKTQKRDYVAPVTRPVTHPDFL